jgi:hypothetical protein
MRLRLLGTVVAAAAFVASPAHADVRVSMANGRVTVVATDATPRQILEEWARIGQTRIVNADRLIGPPMSLELQDVPEAQALDTLLRSASGYVAAPRADDLPNASQFDRIFILATSSPARPAAAPPAAQGPAPAPAPFRPPVFPSGGDSPPAEQQIAQPPAQPGAVAPRPPVFTTFPQPQPIPPRPAEVQPPAATGNQVGGPAMPSATPGAAPQGAPVIGSTRPGLPVPVPQQPGQAPQTVPGPR